MADPPAPSPPAAGATATPSAAPAAGGGAPSTYRAVVVGATGAVGTAVVRRLLTSPRCVAVYALTRRPLEGAAGSQAAFRAVDHDLAVAFASRFLGTPPPSAAAGRRYIGLVSAYGASPTALGFYSRAVARFFRAPPMVAVRVEDVAAAMVADAEAALLGEAGAPQEGSDVLLRTGPAIVATARAASAGDA
ncbi:hypothetical protein I4F81_003122 [Pyropia yezoensis]|uniref:Uncharacterized protein n=1 Tax=Pyropia yezoensis TaxID=2788 RepID=A0ACC3BSG5_PYRYE|nr:hypothetical protein I4F81_003122 [Neopyropia yezoensis]